MQLTYNESIEVTKNQYIVAKTTCAGLIAFRTENDKFFVKLLSPKHRQYCESHLNSIN